jgi:hypothetical protein
LKRRGVSRGTPEGASQEEANLRKSTDLPSSLKRWLGQGDLRSDGQANEVADLVARRPDLLPDLIDALETGDPQTRGHAADALEKIARIHPHEVTLHMPLLLRRATTDRVGMVRWHLAMVLGHTAMIVRDIAGPERVLLGLLGDQNALVRSWAVTSLCIISRLYPARTSRIVTAVSRLSRDRSAAVAKRARKAVEIMTVPSLPFPKGWIKSRHIHLA